MSQYAENTFTYKLKNQNVDDNSKLFEYTESLNSNDRGCF